MGLYLKRSIERSLPIRSLYWLAVLNFVDLWSILVPVRKQVINKRKRVLFVKMDGIGDYFIWTTTFRSIEEIYPSSEYERILIAPTPWQGLLEDCKIFDQQILISPYKFVVNPFYRFAHMRTIRGLRAEIAIHARISRDFLWGDSIIRCSGATQRIGTHGITNRMTRLQESLSDRWYTKLLNAPRSDDHEIVSHKNFIESVGNGRIGNSPLTLPETPAEVSIDRFNLPKDYAVLFVGVQLSNKRWPAANFAEVAKALADEYGLEIVVCGGPGEEHLGDPFAQVLPGPFYDLIGKTTLTELFSLINKASLVVTNDTIAGHFATAAKRPLIVITPGFHPGRYFPYPADLTEAGKQIPVMHRMPCFNCDWKCVFTDLPPDATKPCVQDISTESVIDAARTILALN